MTPGSARVAIAAGAAVAIGGLGVFHPFAPVVAVGGVWFVAFGVSSPFVALLGFVVILLTRLPELVPALAPFHLAKIAALAAMVLFVVSKVARRDVSWASMPHNRWVLAVSAIALVSAYLGTDPRASLLYFTDIFVKILILYFLILNLVDRPSRAVSFQVVFACGAAFLGGYAIYAQLTGQAMIEGTRAGGIGMLGDPNDLALTLLIPLPFLILGVGATRGGKRVAMIALLLIVVGGILATQSRGGLLGVAAGSYLLLRRRFHSRLLTWGAVAVGLVGLILLADIGERQTISQTGIDESAQGRLDAWIAGWRMFRWNPITGVGLARFAENYPMYAINPVEWRPKAAHNSLIQATAETGFLGGIAFIALVVTALRSGVRLWRRELDIRGLHGAVVRAQLPTLVSFLVAASFLSQAWNWFLYILIAFVAATERIEDERKGGAPGTG